MLEVLTRAGCFVAIIILGYVLKKIGVFKEQDFSVLSKVVMKITLPAAIVSSFVGKVIDPSMLTLVLLGLGGGVVYMIFGYVLNRKRGNDQQAFEILNIPGYNIGTFALPFTQSFLGATGVLTTSLFDVGNAFVCLGGAFGVARAIKEGGKMDLKRLANALLTSIPFMTHLVMVTLNLLQLKVPGPILTFTGIVGNANTFLAMLMLGVGFRLSAEREKVGAMVKVLGIRFGFAIVLALLWYFLLPFDLLVRQTLVVLMFAPIGTAVPVFTRELGEDEGLSSAINSVSIIISIVIIVTLLTVML